MNAITFLIKEHNRFRKTFAKIAKKPKQTSSKTAFANLCQDLIRHEKMEQTVWYPHFKRKKGIKAEVKHLLGEERHAAKAIKGFKYVKNETEWKKKFSKFKKAVEHHAREEETMLFPNIEEILPNSELIKIGKTMQQFKKRFNKKKKSH